MHKRGVLHVFLFVSFFSVGAVGLGGAVLCDDLIRYYQNQCLVRNAQDSLKRLESLNAEYDALLEQLENHPELLERIVPVTLGTEPNDPDTAYPHARAKELAIAREALIEQAEQDGAQPDVPTWLRRASDPPKRIALFIAGAGLILISLSCFTPRAIEEG